MPFWGLTQFIIFLKFPAMSNLRRYNHDGLTYFTTHVTEGRRKPNPVK